MSTNGNTTDEKSNGTSSMAAKSQFLSHLQTYPLLTSALTTLTSNPYASTPLSLTHRTIDTLTPYATPFLAPVAPYLTPYLTRLDVLASSGLDAFDARVPAAKKPTKELYEQSRELYEQTRELALKPYTLSREGGDFVYRTYEGEVKRADAKGVFGYGRAVVGTG
ncbi:hypothetical protein V493_04003, partial [Pseudogymnoascus sp. VKM F-4281 (FW-2241)]